MCGKDRPEKDREGSVVDVSSSKTERTHKGRHCKGSIKIRENSKAGVKLGSTTRAAVFVRGGKPDPDSRERGKSSLVLN